jgi:hypothetical protein
LAQDVVNGVRQLEETYPLAQLWNQRAAEFLALREQPYLEPYFESIEVAKADLQRAVRDLLARTSELQQELALEYGLPPVDPAASDLL